MCMTCDAMNEAAGRGEWVCGSCGSLYDLRCAQGHWYCRCAEAHVPYEGGEPTPCFRCQTGL
jgi:hypothetical protein